MHIKLRHAENFQIVLYLLVEFNSAFLLFVLKSRHRFKEWSKEAVITRATWSKSRTSRSKIREQTLSLNSVRVSWGYFKRIVIFKTLGKSSSLERISIALKPLSNAARVESVWPLSTSNLTCGGIVYVLTEFSIAEL
ncbi:hypothetical protein T06_4668 [Trichinella sp. T6]|nr:hypothetical protein T06_4668 [Trichinella sp. T6]